MKGFWNSFYSIKLANFAPFIATEEICSNIIGVKSTKLPIVSWRLCTVNVHTIYEDYAQVEVFVQTNNFASGVCLIIYCPLYYFSFVDLKSYYMIIKPSISVITILWVLSQSLTTSGTWTYARCGTTGLTFFFFYFGCLLHAYRMDSKK